MIHIQKKGILKKNMELIVIAGVDISHLRLVDLTKLADQAKPFYDWVEKTFQETLHSGASLEDILISMPASEIKAAITSCYLVQNNTGLPFLFDGVGRSYSHSKACYYFFSWLIRDAPQQRLSPLVNRIVKNANLPRVEVEIEVLTTLITRYRKEVKTFSWEAIREVVIDRLEGSRRSIKGHEKETVVRTALLIAIQHYYDYYKNYGVFSGVEISEGQISIESESYDVSVNCLDDKNNILCRILVPIKTRETEGGGHSHLFTRDILSAIKAAKNSNVSDYLAVIIVAKNWSQREMDNLATVVDHISAFDLSPSEFTAFDTEMQNSLNHFIENVFNGTIQPRRLIEGL